MHLSVRPVTRLALLAPLIAGSNGRGQGARSLHDALPSYRCTAFYESAGGSRVHLFAERHERYLSRADRCSLSAAERRSPFRFVPPAKRCTFQGSGKGTERVEAALW